MALQVAARYGHIVANTARGLLPHIFTLALRRLFSVTLRISFHPSALSAVQCSVLSGLSSLSGDGTACRLSIYSDSFINISIVLGISTFFITLPKYSAPSPYAKIGTTVPVCPFVLNERVSGTLFPT